MKKTSEETSPAIDTRIVLNGLRKGAASGATFQSINPMTGAAVGTYTECSAEVVAEAVETARQAFDAKTWSAMPIGGRCQVVSKWAELLEDAVDELARLDMMEMGMPISQAKGDVTETAGYMRALCALAQSLTTEAGVTAPGSLCVNIRQPIGVVAAIAPWNFPLNQAAVKILPPLIMGNSVVLKPSEIAPASALRLADLGMDAGLPPGVLSVITGQGHTTGAALTQQQVDKITFTGSTKTGAAIQASATQSGRPLPLAMELGGKSPQIVGQSFGEVSDIAGTIANNVFWNAGQVCTAGSLLIVHEDHADALCSAIADASVAFSPADPSDPSTATGPIATRLQYDRVVAHMRAAEASGASVICGGLEATQALPGLFAAPTAYANLPGDAPLLSAEVFGPVLAIAPFKTKEEALALAVRCGYGLTATVWTKDMSEGHFFAHALPGATVTINGHAGPLPDFSGALGFEPSGRSGFGEDFGLPGLKQYTKLKLAIFNTAQ
ncbi:MAG: aldehyde dehydrogenase family protein [Pseudomonadota bacterium]